MTINLDTLRKTAEAATPGPWDLYSTQDYEVFCATNFTDSNYDPPAVTYGSDRSEDAEFIATFDPPTVIELIERAEAAERALEFHTQRDRELKTLLSMISDRLDEFCYDELSSLIEDSPLDQWGELYKSRLEHAEQAVARVRELHERIPVVVNGRWEIDHCKFCYEQDFSSDDAVWPCPTIRALDGDGRRLSDDALGGDNNG